MNITTYQAESALTAIYPNFGHNLEYPTLGLCGEAGEIANKVKKISRDHNGVITEDMRAALASELGDVLWYLARVADELEVSLDFVAYRNLHKLHDRMARNELGGSGDNR